MIYAIATNQMHVDGAPYTHWAPWRDEFENPIRRPVLKTVIPILPSRKSRTIQLQLSTHLAREDSRIEAVGGAGATEKAAVGEMERGTPGSQFLSPVPIAKKTSSHPI